MKIVTKQTTQAHEAAQSAWDDYEAHRAQNDTNRRAENPGVILPPRRGRAKSPIGGLGERVRAERAAAFPLTPAAAAKAKATRLAKRQFMQDQAKKALAANLQPYVRPVDDGRYFPHQGAREMARRVRQASRAAMNLRAVLAQAAE